MQTIYFRRDYYIFRITIFDTNQNIITNHNDIIYRVTYISYPFNHLEI